MNRLQEHRDAIKAYGVRRFGLCGFFVCGERKETSDLDFVVEFDKKSFDGYMNLKSYLEDLFGCRALIWPLAKQSNRDFDLKESVPIECLDRPFQGWHTTNYNQKVRRA